MSGGDYISFTVPGPPEGKRRPRTRVFGRRATIYTDPKDKAYEAKVAAGAKVAMMGRAPWEGPLVVMVKAWLQVPASASAPRKLRIMDGVEDWFGPSDIDNYLKAVLDGCNGVVWVDDRQVMRAITEKAPTIYGGHVDVVVVRS